MVEPEKLYAVLFPVNDHKPDGIYVRLSSNCNIANYYDAPMSFLLTEKEFRGKSFDFHVEWFSKPYMAWRRANEIVATMKSRVFNFKGPKKVTIICVLKQPRGRNALVHIMNKPFDCSFADDGFTVKKVGVLSPDDNIFSNL